MDVNVHPAKTEVKFLSEKAVFDCIHYGVLGALNKQTDRPQVQFKQKPVTAEPVPAPVAPPAKPAENDMSLRATAHTGVAIPQKSAQLPKKDNFYRTMTAEEYKTFSSVLKDAPRPKPEAAAATLNKIERPSVSPLRSSVMLPQVSEKKPVPVPPPVPTAPPVVKAPVKRPDPVPVVQEEPEQVALDMPKEIEWRMVGELFNSYIIVEQGEDSFLIDKHAAHERILFEKLKANQEKISAQTLLSPVSLRLSPSAAGALLENTALLEELGFEIEEFGENTVLLRQIPMDLSPDMAAEAAETLAADLLSGRRESKDTVRDELLHTVACKAAIKAGWKNDEKELLALVKEVMAREELKYCPHGRPICVTLSKKQLEKQFKRT